MYQLNISAPAAVPFDCKEISRARYVHVTVNIWLCALPGLHGLAAGLQSHNGGSERPLEGLLGAGEQAAGSQLPAGSSDSRLGRQEQLSLPGVVPAGTDRQGAPCPGQISNNQVTHIAQLFDLIVMKYYFHFAL